MNNYVDPEFFIAFDHYKAMLEQYGDDHLITERVFLLTLHYTPDNIKAEMNAKAKELNLLAPTSGHLNKGKPVYILEEIAKHFGISFEEAEQQLLRMMDNREKVGFSSDGILADTHVNCM